MSFPPPGPPMPMPGMPPVPPMMPPPYHPVPPMVLFSGGMIPMTVGMMPAPMMTPVAMAVPPSLPMPPHPKSPMKKHMPPMPYKRHEWMNKLREFNKKDFSTGVPSQAPKGPPVTVFVGNITERASDSLIRQILQRCGTVVNWKRVQGANGKLQAFGFCEYGDPESGLRAIRLLHDWQIGEKKLVVKVDAKTKEKLDEYKAAKWTNQNKATTTAEATTEENKSEEKKEAAAADDKGDEVDENTKKEDLLIKSSIDDIIRDHSIELSRPVDNKAADAVETENHLGWLNSFSDKRILKSYQLRKLYTLSQNNNATNKETPPAEKQRKSTKPPETQPKSRDENTRDSKNDLDEMDLEEEKKSLIHREIDKFRDTYKRAEEEKEKERERKERDSNRDSSSRSRHRDLRDKERKSSSRRERTPARERDNRESERARERERERERERTRSPIERNRGKDKIERLMARSRSRSRDRGWSQERERSRERSRDKDVEKDRDRDDEEDAYDRKKMDRKLREKEAAYQERLRNWEARERRKAKDYEKARQKEEDQKQEEAKEARRLKEFLEDYDDERDDPKYYKGSALARRLKEREKEVEVDNHDRRKEKEEIEEVRRQLVEKGHPDPDGELERLHQEEQAKLLQPKAKVEPSDSEGEPEPPLHLPKMKPIVKQEVVEEEVKATKHPIEDDNTQNSLSGFSDVITTQEEAKPLGFGVLRLGGSPTHVARSPSTTTTNNTQSGQKKKISLQDVFNDDDSSEQRKKRKLIPLDDVLEESAKLAGSSQQNMSMEEKRKHIKNLIDKIPTAKEELFAFTLDWSLVDKPLMERKIKPWINKKIVEYIGEEEPTLVDFICSKVLAGSAAQSILDDVSMVLDEEAEVFVVKMWRLLIYEIEAKKLGLMR